MDDLRPVRWVIVVGFLVALAGHACDHEGILGVRLILALGVQVKEHRAVSIEDWLHADALPVVLVVFFVLVDCPQPPRTNAAAHGFFKSVVVGLISHRCLLVCSVQAITDFCQLCVVRAIF